MTVCGRFDGTIVIVYVTGSVCQFCRWNGVRPEARAGRVTVVRLGEDGGYEQGDRVVSAGGALTAVRAAGAGGDVAADQGQHGGERDEVRVEAGGAGGAGGERGGHVVHEQQRPGLLPGKGGGASAQHATGSPDGFPQVQVRDFCLPSFCVQGGDLPGRERVRVEQGGEHLDRGGLGPAGGAGADGEADQPGDGAREPGQGLVLVLAAPLAEHGVRFAQQHQFRPVGQGPDGLERDGLRAVPGPPGQVGAARGEPDPPIHGEEPAVSQAEDPGGERALQLISQGVLPVVVAADGGGDPAAGPGARVRGDPDLRLGAARGHPERVRELSVIEQLDGGAVHAGGLHAVPGRADARLHVATGRVQLEDLPHDLLTQQHAHRIVTNPAGHCP